MLPVMVPRVGAVVLGGGVVVGVALEAGAVLGVGGAVDAGVPLALGGPLGCDESVEAASHPATASTSRAATHRSRPTAGRAPVRIIVTPLKPVRSYSLESMLSMCGSPAAPDVKDGLPSKCLVG